MPKKKLADRLREAVRVHGYSIRTEKAYVGWYERFVRFHQLRHPSTMGAPAVEEFLTHLAAEAQVSASTQNQALAALLFLYRAVLKIPIGDVQALRAKPTQYVQTYLSHAECLNILSQLRGVNYLVVAILYGAGLRLLECLRLRIQDDDFEGLTLTAHDTKSNRDRATFLPDDEVFLKRFREHLERVRQDFERHPAPVSMPPALERKFRGVARRWEWQYVFPARGLSVDPRSRKVQRHHLHMTGVQRAITGAVRAAEIHKRVTAHTFRHAFVTRLVEEGRDIKDIQQLVGHVDVRTTMRYIQHPAPPTGRLKSPLGKKG